MSGGRKLPPELAADTDHGMAMLSKAEIIKRLGMAPELFEFRGQCYDAGEGHAMNCAITQRPTRYCFTLKARDGRKGRVTIGPASFFMLKKYAPKLYMQLERGRQFLILMNENVQRQRGEAALRKSMSDNNRKLNSLRNNARNAVAAWREANRRGELPEILANLKLLMQRRKPDLADAEAERLWVEQNILEIETLMLQMTPEPAPAPVTTAVAVAPPTPEAPVAAPQPRRAFSPVPEIEF